ncbi:MAG: hypothetical protein WCT11_00970 [Candidatus Magasanikbacteria bacterium]
MKKIFIWGGTILTAMILIYITYSFSHPNKININTIISTVTGDICHTTPTLKDRWGRDPSFDIEKLATTTMTVKLLGVVERPGVRPDLKLTEQRGITILLARPDLKLDQTKCVGISAYTGDLPVAIQPKRMVADYGKFDQKRDMGASCDYVGLPHSCTLDITATDKPIDVLIKVAFQDNTYAEQKITIPYGGHMDQPVITSPLTAPKNGDNFSLQFKDVGANSYNLRVVYCHPYENDGINPCLFPLKINLQRIDGKMTITDSSNISGLTATVKNGVVILKSQMPLLSEEKDDKIRYNIDASKSGKTNDGISTGVESTYSLSLPLK